MTVPGNLSSPLLATAAAAAAAGDVATKSLRFNSGDSAYLNRTPSSAGNRKTFTFSAWVKKTSTGSTFAMLGTGTDSTNLDALDFNGEQLRYTRSTSGSFLDVKTSALFRDPSAWYHVVLAVDTTQSTASNRVKLYVNGAQQTSLAASNYPSQNEDTFINSTEPQVIGRRSAHQDNYFDGYMADAYLIDGSQLDPTSFGAYDDNGVWQAAAYSGTYGTNGFHLDFADGSDLGDDNSGNDNDFTANNLTGTQNQRFSSAASATGGFESSNPASNGFNGTLTSGNRANGVTVGGTIEIKFNPPITVSSTVGIWSGKSGFKYQINDSGSYTSVTDATEQWHDASHSGTLTNLKIQHTASNEAPGFSGIRVDGTTLIDGSPENLDLLFDVPTNGSQTDNGYGGEVSGNYATLNPLTQSSQGTIENGNLEFRSTSSQWGGSSSTIGMQSGKFYMEVNGGSKVMVGITSDPNSPSDGGYHSRSDSYTFYSFNGNKVNSDTQTSYSSAWSSSSDVVGALYDADNGTLSFYRNGVSQGNAFTSLDTSKTWHFVAYTKDSTAVPCNFGQRAFVFSTPTNFKALFTTNLTTPTIADGSEYFDIALYTGTTQSPRTITGLNISEPDWVWVKNRNDSSPHLVWDAVRGTDKNVRTDTTNTESAVSGSSNGIISTSAANGFVVKNGSSSGTNVGSSGTDPIVAWCWEAGSSTVSNTDGSITSSVRASQTAGFSVLTYTGSANGTVGHGLNAAPEFIIAKSRTVTKSWICYHKALGKDKYLLLNTTNAAQTSSGVWGSAEPTSSVFGLENSSTGGNTDGNLVAYCISPVAGFSAVGSYEGNGSADGPFVHCGFKPRWIMMKNADTGGTYYDWRIIDTARHTYNEGGNEDVPPTLFANLSDAEKDWDNVDILSNGFKIKDSSVSLNESGATQIFIAFAENPFQANGGLAR